MHHKFVLFPFTAIVGQELMKKGLLVNSIDPSIGGILIKGDKGTGKSTAVRALADLLPEIKSVENCQFNCHPENIKLMCKSCQHKFERDGFLPCKKKKMEVVDMPLSATEDMIIGTIDIKKVLKDGIKALEPGLLAKANRNILYIDEVNLLDDHIVNILLDASAMGVNTVEREGISLYHPSRFILIGTMNPEEGDLRPQLLDRFGLCVEMSALTSKDERLKIITRRREFDLDPWKFEQKFYERQEALKNKIIYVQSFINNINMPQEIIEYIVDLICSLGIKTHRADIVIDKTSRAIAALAERDYVTLDDVNEAVLLALPHRMRENPFKNNESLTKENIEAIIHSKTKDEVFDFDKEHLLKKNSIKLDTTSLTRGRNFPKTLDNRGLYVKAKSNKNPDCLAIDATIRKAIKETGELKIEPEHLMEKVRISTGKALYIILLDSSSSMRMDKKIRLAKTLAWNILKESYTKKDELCLFSFRNENNEMLVPPTQDMIKVEEALENLPTGGKTPLTPALYQTFQMAKKEKDASPFIILISDGRGNVFIKNSLEEDIDFISSFKDDINLLIINTEARKRSIGILEDISIRFKANHFHIEEVL